MIRAAINIKKGEHISINYSDPMWGSANRQLHLGECFIVKLKLSARSGQPIDSCICVRISLASSMLGIAV